MTSMRKLKRRLLRWERYDNRNVRSLDEARRVTVPPGLTRASRAVEAEDDRRFWAETPEVWLGGPVGEAALIADVLDEACLHCLSKTCAGGCSETYAEAEVEEDHR